MNVYIIMAALHVYVYLSVCVSIVHNIRPATPLP